MEDGVDLLMRGQYEEAVARFDVVVQADSNFAEAFNKRSTAYFLSGRVAGQKERRQGSLAKRSADRSQWQTQP